MGQDTRSREIRPANGESNTKARGPSAADYEPMVRHVRSLRSSATTDDETDKSWPELAAVVLHMPTDASAQQAALVAGEFNGDVNAYKSFVQEVGNRGDARRGANAEAQAYYSAYAIRKRITDAGGKSWPALDAAVAQQEANAKRAGSRWPPA